MFQHRPLHPLQSQRQMPTCSRHTHTDTLPIHLGGVDNHKDLLNGGGRSSLYQVLLYRPHDKWDCHDGWGWGAEGPTTRWIELKPQNELRRWAGLGCHLVWWTPRSCRGGDEWVNAFLLTALKWKGERKCEREGRVHPTSTGGWCMTRLKTVKSY